MLGLKLYCLPHSGASAMVYSRWRRKLPAWLAIHPVELPGRGLRMAEPLQQDMSALVAQLATEISHDISLNPSQPYAFLGHSLGALLAFELAHALVKKGCSAPVVLFASGTAAPTRREEYEEKLSEPKSDEQLIDDLRTLEGTSEDALANKELMALILPVMRADYLLCGGYRYHHSDRLVCPLHVLAGSTDKATDEQLNAWQQETSAEFSLTKFDGGHFFIQQHEDKVLAHIKLVLTTLPNVRAYKYA
ncbi:MAG: thioesterase [Gammaproteobacteria bacterium]|nr:thioesterase [Gammaproteobacteria bacterium]